MFIFVKFNFTLSAGTPHPSINEMTEWRHYRKSRGDMLLRWGWEERTQRLHFSNQEECPYSWDQEITDLFLLLGYSSNIFQYVVLDSSGNGQEENMLTFKAPQKTRDHKIVNSPLTLNARGLLARQLVGESFFSPLGDSPSRIRLSILSPPTRKKPWHPGYSPLNDALESAHCSVRPSQTLSLHIPVSGRSYVIGLFYCLRSLVSCKRAAHLTSFLRKTWS